jgi:hypothetical protein
MSKFFNADPGAGVFPNLRAGIRDAYQGCGSDADPES